MKEIKTDVKSTAAANTGAVLEDTGMGEITIDSKVISALVRKAVMGVEGVSRLSGSQLVDIIAETVGSRRMQDRAIVIQVDDGKRVVIDINVNLKFGFKIPGVSTAIQKAVIAEVEDITGMTVTRVNVIVQELEMPEEGEDSGESADIILPSQH